MNSIIFPVEIDDSQFCWEKKSLSVDAITATKDALTDYNFKQTGYVMNIDCDFDDVNLVYILKTNKNISGQITDVKKNAR